MKRLHTNVKYPCGYKVHPGDVVEISTPTQGSVGTYIVMDGYKGDGRICSRCVLSYKNTGKPCPMPFDNNGCKLCSFNYVFLEPIEAVLEDL